jgi:hypothetical protein
MLQTATPPPPMILRITLVKWQLQMRIPRQIRRLMCTPRQRLMKGILAMDHVRFEENSSNLFRLMPDMTHSIPRSEEDGRCRWIRFDFDGDVIHRIQKHYVQGTRVKHSFSMSNLLNTVSLILRDIIISVFNIHIGFHSDSETDRYFNGFREENSTFCQH